MIHQNLKLLIRHFFFLKNFNSSFDFLTVYNDYSVKNDVYILYDVLYDDIFYMQNLDHKLNDI